MSETGVHKKRSGAEARVFAYCHDSVGIGHLARTLTICRNVSRGYPKASFLIATGTPYIALFDQHPRVDYIKLPALAKVDARSYQSKYLSCSTEELIRYRSAVLVQTVKHFEPDVVLVDKAPLGVCGELVAALKWLRNHRPETRIIFGMRDIEDSAVTTIEQWTNDGVPQMLESCFDEVWVYGMQSLFDVLTQYELPESVVRKTHFTGYVVEGRCAHPNGESPTAPTVLVTVGGGTDGEFLLDTYLRESAERLSRRGVVSTIVAGPDLPTEIGRELRHRVLRIGGLQWIDFEPCLNCRIRDAKLVVSMGGYNTLCQIARNRRPALIVPRVHPRQEQVIRAKLWAEQGVVDLINPVGLTPTALAERIEELLDSHGEQSSGGLDLRGLDRIMDRFRTFWQPELQHASPLRMQ